MSKKVTDLPVGSADGADLYAASGGNDTRVTGGGANGVATLDADTKVPNAQLHLGENGGPAGPLDTSGKIPNGQLPPLQHDVGEAADEASMLALSVTAPAMALRTDFTPAHIFMLTADPASDISNWHDTGELGAGAADPAAKVGPNATNGVASTFMRSDAAPAIDLTANYVWTGGHDFHEGAAFSRVSGENSPSLLINSSNPQFEIKNTGASVNESRWNLAAISDQLVFRALNDAGDVADNAWIMTRSAGTVTAHSFQVNGNPILDLGTGGYITVYEDIHMSEKKIVNLTAPTNDKDAANKAYVDSKAGGGVTDYSSLTGKPINIESGTSQLGLKDQDLIWPAGHTSKIRLVDNVPGNAQQYTGFAVEPGGLIYQVYNNSQKHVFRGATTNSGLTILEMDASTGIVAHKHLNMNGNKLTVNSPSDGTDAANKNYVDGRLSAAQRSAIDALSTIADPSTASTTAVANKINDVINALKAT